MIHVRAYMIMDRLHVATAAVVAHDPHGNPIAPTTVGLWAGDFPARSSLDGRALGVALGRWAAPLDRSVGEEFGGWHCIL